MPRYEKYVKSKAYEFERGGWDCGGETHTSGVASIGAKTVSAQSAVSRLFPSIVFLFEVPKDRAGIHP